MGRKKGGAATIKTTASWKWTHREKGGGQKCEVIFRERQMRDRAGISPQHKDFKGREAVEGGKNGKFGKCKSARKEN